MLTRVYGTAWESEEQLAAYHHMQQEAARRDHRKLGSQLQLFSIQVRPGHLLGRLIGWLVPASFAVCMNLGRRRGWNRFDR
jgi:threonyl-tRNA synthetase